MPLPDFIIIGSMKSGTTSLYRTLAMHPDIGMSRDKETDFFVAEKSFSRGLAWYESQFDDGKPIHGEASPNYTKADDFKDVPLRIRTALPEVKLIYMVRDPVDRFVSQFRHSWTMGEIAVRSEDLQATHQYAHILNTSRYARQLEAFLSVFPSEQLLVVDFAELIKSRRETLAAVLEFIGAAAIDIPETGVHNENAEISRIPAPLLRFAQSPLGRSFSRIVSREGRDRVRGMLAMRRPRQPPAFPEFLLDRVREDLRDDVARFRQLTGRPFAHWSV